jgi:hypothetical protein
MPAGGGLLSDLDRHSELDLAKQGGAEVAAYVSTDGCRGRTRVTYNP